LGLAVGRRLLEADDVEHHPRGVGGAAGAAHRDRAADRAAGRTGAGRERQHHEEAEPTHQNAMPQSTRGAMSMWLTPMRNAPDSQERPWLKATSGPTPNQLGAAFSIGKSPNASAPTRSSSVTATLMPPPGRSSVTPLPLVSSVCTKAASTPIWSR